MGDEQIGQAELLLERTQKVDDLRLNGNVQRGNRLVAEDEIRIQRKNMAMQILWRWPPENSCGYRLL